MTRQEFIKRVALKMDEISSSNGTIVTVVDSGDNNPLYALIGGLINESVNDVLVKAPIFRLQKNLVSVKTFTKGATSDKSRATAVINVPADFIRVASITDTNFQRPVVDLAIEGDDMDKKQHNKFLVAKSAKPVAVIGQGANGRTITCYSYGLNNTPAPEMLYVKRCSGEGDLDFDDYLIDIMSWVCAGRVFAAQGDPNRGKLCDENAASLMI